MKLVEVKSVSEISVGDLAIVKDSDNIRAYTIEQIKEQEVILAKRGNKYFNFEIYLEGESWVKEFAVIR